MAVGEDGDGTVAAGAQAGEVGAGAAGVELGADPPAAPVNLQGGRPRGVAGGAYGHLLAQELGECGAETHLQGALPGAGAYGLVGDCPLGDLWVELGEHALGVLGAGGLQSEELADGVQSRGAGDFCGDGVGPQAVRAHVLALGAARAALQVLAGADEEVPEPAGVVVVGEVTGASGHGVVQQEGGTSLTGGAAGHGVGDGGDAQVVGGAAGGDLQSQEDRGGQRVHPHPVGGETERQDKGECLSAQLAHEVDGDHVLGGVAAVAAPGPVLAGGGGPGVRVELAAGLAQAEVP